jgi:hypothetical protein
MPQRSSRSLVDAAALQSDLARRIGLSNAPSRRVRPNASNSNRSRELVCPSCSTRNNDRLCTSCGVIIPANSTLEQHSGDGVNGGLSLAESRGLVKVQPVVPALTPAEWNQLESSASGRQDAFCPICMEGFRGHEVLLSCSHMFHQVCLRNFERFMRVSQRACPICRTGQYQKKVTHQGSRAFEVVCARRVQVH